MLCSWTNNKNAKLKLLSVNVIFAMLNHLFVGMITSPVYMKITYLHHRKLFLFDRLEGFRFERACLTFLSEKGSIY